MVNLLVLIIDPHLLQIVKESYADHTQFDRKDPHYDRLEFTLLSSAYLIHQMSPPDREV